MLSDGKEIEDSVLSSYVTGGTKIVDILDKQQQGIRINFTGKDGLYQEKQKIFYWTENGLQNFNRSPPAVAERKHAARIGIKFEFQLDNYSQSVIAFSQIGSSTGKVNGCATCQIKHDLSVPV